MIKTYYSTIKAVQWNGTEVMLEFLKTIQTEHDCKMWTVGEIDGAKALRVNKISRQGDYWLDVGDYLEIDTKNKTVWDHKRWNLENKYKEFIQP